MDGITDEEAERFLETLDKIIANQIAKIEERFDEKSLSE